MALAVITAVGYDYILTFSNEIEYIWNKPWTWVSMLFVFIRYLGLYSAAISSLEKSSFLPGSQKMYVFVPPSLSELSNTSDIY
ncbi:hypothetical protein HD554DRAFT_2150028 [Boletus coccyginus]|nr:hypothetical protein HD554DRAFT_2150028 [Boletus coccyginus]